MTTAVENLRVDWVHRDLILCGITDETFGVRERNIGGGCPVTLVVGDDLNTIILPDTNTAVQTGSAYARNARSPGDGLRVGGAQIDTDSFSWHYLRVGLGGWMGRSAKRKDSGERLKFLFLIFIQPQHRLIEQVFPTKKHPEGSRTFERIRKRRDRNPLEPPTSVSQLVGG
jgi:hypothetical protein